MTDQAVEAYHGAEAREVGSCAACNLPVRSIGQHQPHAASGARIVPIPARPRKPRRRWSTFRCPRCADALARPTTYSAQPGLPGAAPTITASSSPSTCSCAKEFYSRADAGGLNAARDGAPDLLFPMRTGRFDQGHWVHALRTSIALVDPDGVTKAVHDPRSAGQHRARDPGTNQHRVRQRAVGHCSAWSSSANRGNDDLVAIGVAAVGGSWRNASGQWGSTRVCQLPEVATGTRFRAEDLAGDRLGLRTIDGVGKVALLPLAKVKIALPTAVRRRQPV